MKNYYTMKEVFYKCGDNDVPYIKNSFNDKSGKTKKELLRHDKYHPSLADSLSDKWQIKRPWTKVLTAEKWTFRQATNRALSYLENWHLNRGRMEGFEAGDRNGQLKRDLVYIPLVAICNEMLDYGTANTTPQQTRKLMDALENIPTLED